MVTRALVTTGLDPHLLELELTESALMHDVRRVSRTLDCLKEIGVRLAVDDFGTGYSSLSYLKSFPLDYLKIDRSFIRDVPSDANDRAIVRAIIAMAHSLGIKVIAEGVETAEQLAFLTAQHCDEIQGYLLCKPVPGTELEAGLRNGLHLTPKPPAPPVQD
jgi:EAL domain-containing protein (putative c-di-GMP-specific phosphodiesterase class I)